MISKRFLLVRFKDDAPVWDEFDGQWLKPVSPPGSRSRLPILALLPDKFFFFYQPEGLNMRSERQLRAATLLQMGQLFPVQTEGQERGVMRPGGDGPVLGYVSHPGLTEFLKRWRPLLDKASVVATPFILAWHAAAAAKLTAWTWRDDSGPTALFAHHRLFYLSGNGDDLKARQDVLDLTHPPKLLTLEGVLADVSASRSSLARLRLPLNLYAESEADSKPLVKALAVASLAGLLFCAGQYLRWSDIEAEARAVQGSLAAQYRQALGDKAGSDPYGQLLFRLSQAKGSQNKGVDVLELMETMSRAAAGALRVETFSITPEAGGVRGKIENYNQLEAFMKALGEQNSRYSFTLEQATTVNDGVQFSLRVGL